MKFVALVSGGKDSIYNLCKCIEHGHTLVAAANLVPPNAAEEIDSFMYQSAGHVVIEAIAECLGVPLVRREIRGTALQQGLHYTPTAEDEVEDLFLLLQDVKERFPDVQGVAVGAILSNYQRDRVENVCDRLGLTCLAFLWQKNQKMLLQEMIDYGIDAVLCKVAAAGLDPYVHLGKSIRQLQPFFLKLNAKFGFHVCGEGGEYETLVLDCPVYQKRLKITQSAVHMCGDDQTVAILSVLAHETVPKDVPPQVPQQREETQITQEHAVVSPGAVIAAINAPQIVSDCRVNTDGVGNTGVISPRPVADASEDDVVLQTRQVLSQMQRILQAVGSSLRDVVIVRLYVRDMSHFHVVNREYCTWFDRHPPSRCCVAVRLPLGIFVEAEAVFMRNSAQAMLTEGCNLRKVMHIRSISEWAPVCIGPYSQANVLADCVVFVAGQIGLDPASMALVSGTGTEDDRLDAELRQAVANTAAILDALDSSLSSVVSCICYVNTSKLPAEVMSSTAFYATLHESLARLLSSEEEQNDDAGSDRYDSEEDEELTAADSKLFANAPTLIIPVDGLPRDALVEVEVIAVTHRQKILPYSCDETLIASNQEQLSATSRHTADLQVDQWPIWQFGEQQTPSGRAELHAELQIKYTPLALCSLTVDIRLKDQAADAAHASLAEIASTFAAAVRQATELSRIPFREILFVQCFYAADSLPVEALSHRIASSLPDFPVVSFVPLPHLKPHSLVQARVFAMNTVQLETEMWTHQQA